jgi:hypothetical protein
MKSAIHAEIQKKYTFLSLLFISYRIRCVTMAPQGHNFNLKTVWCYVIYYVPINL